MKKLNLKKTKKPKEKLDYKSLTVTKLEQELKRETYKSKYTKVLKSTIYTLIIIAAIATLTATLILPVLQISGSSMEPTYNEGEIVVVIKNQNPKPGDIIAFYHGNKILIKRVIANAGSWINIDVDGSIYVDGEKLNEPYISELSRGDTDIEYPYQVPNESWFVLSDNRFEIIDSRNKEIGSIPKKDIIGKIIFRIWPIKK